MTKQHYAKMAIYALGGSTAVARMFGIDQRVVSNWPRRGLPPETYAALTPLLVERGLPVEDKMFSQRPLVTTKPLTRQKRSAKQEDKHAN